FLMILADKLSGIQLVTFLSTKFSKILHKVHYKYTYLVVFFVVTFVFFVFKIDIAEEWHADFL
ncbi:MAG: hypothetical protein U0264_17175, partial [Candidatus Kapaibacterium sp.]